MRCLDSGYEEADDNLGVLEYPADEYPDWYDPNGYQPEDPGPPEHELSEFWDYYYEGEYEA